jgi:hypothetical protein
LRGPRATTSDWGLSREPFGHIELPFQ